MYEHADQSWRGRPKELNAKTAAQISRRVAEHAAAHRLPQVSIVLHGGEPLLLGPRRMRGLLAELRTTISPATGLDLRIQTNAVQLTERFLDLFAEYDVKVGVSLDGDRTSNDKHRLHRTGRSSYDQVTAALCRLRRPEYRHLYSGLLCTIDISNDPIAVYRALADQQPPRMDLLLPHATWEHQPAGLARARDPQRPTEGGGEYARWLDAIFDAWDADGRPMPIRMFESVIRAHHGMPSTTELLGLAPADLLVIETDGTLEQVDSLKTAYEGAPATGLDVWRNSFDDAAAVPGIAARQQKIDGVSAVCRECELVHVCGGGHYPHRYRPGHGFDNPSVYCADLKEMITHVLDTEDPDGRGVVAPDGGRAETRPREPIPDHDDEDGDLGLRAEEFAGLAAGYGSPTAIRVLARRQAALRRDLLALIAQRGPRRDERFARACDLLDVLSERSPEAVTAVLTHPYTRVWAVELLASLDRNDAAAPDLLHIEALAAGAAVLAGLGERVPVPVRDGVAPLPGLGALTAGNRDVAWCETGSIDELELVHPLRLVDAAGLPITIEDTDPYRGCHGQPTDRLDPEEAERWNRLLPAAIEFVDEHLSEFAVGLRAGLRTVMPMSAPEKGLLRSATARDAFGAIGLALPNDPALLALLLVHEFQHIKLGALLDIAALYDEADTEARYYTPWRPDPRPLEALLQGTYAHVAVTAFWRVHGTRSTGAEREKAQMRFARWRAATAESIDRLLASGSLTGLGRRVAEAMGRTVGPWLDEPVSRHAQREALRSAAQHRAGFEERLHTRDPS